MNFPFPVPSNTSVVTNVFIFNLWDTEFSAFIHDRYGYWRLNGIRVFVPVDRESGKKKG